jgi:large subunit ribosomal protein L15
MAQKNRKIQKMHGSRGCGYGNAQKHRGAGSRGGRGNAGSGKHKQKGILAKFGNIFGKHGFKRHESIQTHNVTINISEIERRFDSLLASDAIQKSGNTYSIDVTNLGYDKVLGTGTPNRVLKVTAYSFSASAKEKIEKAGGEISLKA